MDKQQTFHEALFQGLNALEETSFPRTCSTCGRVYETAQQYLRETDSVSGGKSGLKESLDDNGHHCVEVFRNCAFSLTGDLCESRWEGDLPLFKGGPRGI